MGRQCPRSGFGNPPLCKRHFEMGFVSQAHQSHRENHQSFNEAVDALLNHPMASSLFDVLGQALDRMGQRISRPEDHPYYQGDGRGYAAEWPPRPDAPPPPPPRGRPHRPPPPPPPSAGRDPRQVLGFAPHVRLTAEEIKARKRQLAAIYHPDRGGSLEAMQEINAAADALLAQVR